MAPKVTKRPAAAMGDDEELEDVTGADLVEDAEEPWTRRYQDIT